METTFRDYQKRNIIKQSDYVDLFQLFFILKLYAQSFKDLRDNSRECYFVLHFQRMGTYF